MNVDPPDVAVAPLGIPDQPRGNQFVLAGRFPDPLVPRVVNCVRDAGGEVVANIDEAWTGAGRSQRPSRA